MRSLGEGLIFGPRQICLDSEIESEPILNATDFVFRGISSDPKDPLYAQGQVPLTNFGYLENAKVEIGLPDPGIWEGTVTVCD